MYSHIMSSSSSYMLQTTKSSTPYFPENFDVESLDDINKELILLWYKRIAGCAVMGHRDEFIFERGFLSFVFPLTFYTVILMTHCCVLYDIVCLSRTWHLQAKQSLPLALLPLLLYVSTLQENPIISCPTTHIVF